MKNELNTTNIKDFIKHAKINEQLNDTGREGVTGLHLKVFKSGYSFRVTYRLNGRRRTYKIGNYPTLTATQARKLAKEVLGRVAAKEDPQETKTNEVIKQANTGLHYLDTIYSSILKNKKSGLQTKQMINNYFGSILKKPMESLSAKDITKWQAQKKASGLKFETYRRSYGALKTMLNDAVNRGYLSINPLRDVSLDKVHETNEEAAERKKKRTYLEKAQMISFLQALDAYQERRRQERRNSRSHGQQYLPNLDKVEYVDHVKPMMSMLFYTGFRPGDVIGLRWEEVNLNFKTISKVIEKTAHKKPGNQTFPIASPLVDILKKWKLQHGNPQSGLVFPNPKTNKRFGKKVLQKPWKKIRTLAKLAEELELYTLRHNFASHLVMKGVDLLSIAKLMGHSDVQMIIDHYGHLQPNLLKEHVELFVSLLDDTIDGTSTKNVHYKATYL